MNTALIRLAHLNSRLPRSRLRGQIVVEYAVALAIVAFVFFSGSPSVVEQLVSAFASQFTQFTFLLALP